MKTYAQILEELSREYIAKTKIYEGASIHEEAAKRYARQCVEMDRGKIYLKDVGYDESFDLQNYLTTAEIETP